MILICTSKICALFSSTIITHPNQCESVRGRPRREMCQHLLFTLHTNVYITQPVGIRHIHMVYMDIFVQIGFHDI